MLYGVDLHILFRRANFYKSVMIHNYVISRPDTRMVSDEAAPACV